MYDILLSLSSVLMCNLLYSVCYIVYVDRLWFVCLSLAMFWDFDEFESSHYWCFSHFLPISCLIALTFCTSEKIFLFYMYKLKWLVQMVSCHQNRPAANTINLRWTPPGNQCLTGQEQHDTKQSRQSWTMDGSHGEWHINWWKTRHKWRDIL